MLRYYESYYGLEKGQTSSGKIAEKEMVIAKWVTNG